MKKIILSIGIYFTFWSVHAQEKTAADTGSYHSHKLTVDEVNIVSGYYTQDGNNSAVTGGKGTEQLTDIANTFDVKLSHYDKKDRKRILNFELGIDTYTSASSDKINPQTISSASMHDTRVYPSLGYNIQNEKNGTNIGIVGSYSTEFDYTSFGTGLNFIKSSKDKNRELGIKLQAFFDTWKVIYPIELTPIGYGSGEGRDKNPVSYKPRDSYSATFSLAQVLNKRTQILLIAEPGYQIGLLATKYQRVYFTDNSERVENLPNTRFKIPLGFRLNYFLGDKIILRSFYRYYQDNWGIKSNTFELETPVKLNSFLSISPFYRLYAQNQASYFAAYGMHSNSESYFTSDYDLSTFTSQFVGMGFRITPANGIFGFKYFNSLELRYGHYIRNSGLHSDIVTMTLRFK